MEAVHQIGVQEAKDRVEVIHLRPVTKDLHQVMFLRVRRVRDLHHLKRRLLEEVQAVQVPVQEDLAGGEDKYVKLNSVPIVQ